MVKVMVVSLSLNIPARLLPKHCRGQDSDGNMAMMMAMGVRTAMVVTMMIVLT